MKTCCKCGIEKRTTEFYKRSEGKGFRSHCIACVKSTTSLWTHRNKQRKAIATDVWQKTNKANKNSSNFLYKAKKAMAMPKWADAKKIQTEYELAAWCSKVTGEKYHVDHIVPLKSNLVCGLHNEFNLRVILAKDNIIKGNRHWPDMPTGV